MLGFINDMVISYGSEMKNLIDIQFIDKILFNLRKFKIKKFEDEIFNQEEVIYFYNFTLNKFFLYKYLNFRLLNLL